MTAQQNQQDTAEYRLKIAQEENELLLVQLHQLEEELEQYFLRNQELKKGNSVASNGGRAGFVWVDDELPDALAEIQRLQALVAMLRKVHQLESENSLNVKLGNILIQGVDSPGNLLTVPAKIGKIWRDSNRKNPPKSLGGKAFERVIAAFDKGGFKEVEKLFTEVSTASAIQANGYTALARHLLKIDRVIAAEAARRAYEIDPKPFRLKWLAFRLHEAGDVIEAEAMLEILPANITFSESELRQANQLRSEAKHVRLHEAKQKSGYSESRTEVEKQLEKLEELIRAKTEEEEQNEFLQNQYLKTQKEFESLYSQYEKVKLEIKRQDEIEDLKREEEDQNELLRHQLFKTQEEVENLYAKSQVQEQVKKQLEEEKVALVEEKSEQVKVTTELQLRVIELIKQKTEIEEKLTNEIQTREKMQAKLEQKNEEIAELKEEQSKLTSDLHSQTEKLNRDKEEIEEKLCLEIDTLKQAQAKFAEDKETLALQMEEHAKLAAERLYKINELQQQIKIKQSSEAELLMRQNLMQEEMVRAEAQLDLIKNMLLREPES